MHCCIGAFVFNGQISTRNYRTSCSPIIDNYHWFNLPLIIKSCVVLKITTEGKNLYTVWYILGLIILLIKPTVVIVYCYIFMSIERSRYSRVVFRGMSSNSIAPWQSSSLYHVQSFLIRLEILYKTLLRIFG